VRTTARPRGRAGLRAEPDRRRGARERGDPRVRHDGSRCCRSTAFRCAWSSPAGTG
jgi:hypothetical protein